jgi:hypothetical protein
MLVLVTEQSRQPLEHFITLHRGTVSAGYDQASKQVNKNVILMSSVVWTCRPRVPQGREGGEGLLAPYSR